MPKKITGEETIKHCRKNWNIPLLVAVFVTLTFIFIHIPTILAADSINIIFDDQNVNGTHPVPNANGEYEGIVNEKITFNSSESYDPDGNITNFT